MDIKTKPLQLRIVTPEGIVFDSSKKNNLVITSIVSRGVIPSKGDYLKGDAIYDFEILPDHTPFIAKVSDKSKIRISSNIGEIVFDTKNGGVVTVSHSNDNTIALFTLQDIIEPKMKNN